MAKFNPSNSRIARDRSLVYTNILTRINENAKKIVEQGYGGNVIFHARLDASLSGEVRKFILNGAIKNMPNEGVFSKLIFQCKDGVIYVTKSGIRFVR